MKSKTIIGILAIVLIILGIFFILFLGKNGYQFAEPHPNTTISLSQVIPPRLLSSYQYPIGQMVY